MRRFHKLKDYCKERDRERRNMTSAVFAANDITYTTPAKGHYKIASKKCHTLMFYPKTGTIIWKLSKKDNQHRFFNEDEGKLIRKIKELI